MWIIRSTASDKDNSVWASIEHAHFCNFIGDSCWICWWVWLQLPRALTTWFWSLVKLFGAEKLTNYMHLSSAYGTPPAWTFNMFLQLVTQRMKRKTSSLSRDARAKTWRGKIIYQPTCSRLMFWLLDRSLITPAAIQKPKKLTCNLLFNLSLSLLLLLRQSVARMNYLSFQWIIDFVSSIFLVIFTLLMFSCSTFELIFQFLKSGWIFITESQGLTHNIRFMFASNAAIIVSDINSALLISDDFPPQIIIPKDVLTTA